MSVLKSLSRGKLETPRRWKEAGMPETIQPHILVVDDDPQIRSLLEEYFAE
jgi:hypothetical protein